MTAKTSTKSAAEARAKTSKRTNAKTNAKSAAGTKVKASSTKTKPSAPKHRVREFFIAAGLISLPLVGGVIITLFTLNAQETFSSFNQPPLAPPAWLFPVAWTILYILMGVASYLIVRAKANQAVEKRLKTAELIVFYVQLALNYAWTLLFFNANLKYFAFGWLVVMWLMIVALMVMCCHNRKAAMWLLAPYLLWCTFAAYLNLGVAILN
ncbi:tryptophan-rich sensory protein [Candidatus Saccharibacteria bacterium]|nr:tryptophan-rich sensory protein [Candidatus Saccharibacteria bacterium]